jgi:HTH-type transcriptional repressor of NAD biosynthesis genes
MKIAILGAECTGKTALAQALWQRLASEHPGAAWVPEYLREWCDLHQRTPRADEQAHIAATQNLRVQALHACALVLSDTAPLMTAVYSDVLFADTSLYAQALEQQRAFDLTLVTGLDLPWVADGLQRDGVAMRTRVDRRLRAVLQQSGIGFSAVYGRGEARTQNALQAIAYARGTRPAAAAGSWRWRCEKCSDPQCEHRLFSALLQPQPAG